MKIISADMQMSSQHQQQRYHRIKETFTESIRPATETRRNNISLQEQAAPNRTAIQPRPQTLSEPTHNSRDLTKTDNAQLAEEPAYVDLFTLLVQSFTGRKIEPINLNNISASNISTESVAINSFPAQQLSSETATESVPDTVIDYHREESYFESESTNFTARGSLTTADGRKIAIDLQNAMHYQYQYEEEINLTLSSRQLLDPLVLNLQGSKLSLSEQRYAFDLNADGNDENTHFVTGNSAFLALDKNGDGAINNGYELFGAITGQGFAELAVYDEDENGFIDEADNIYQQLKLYNKDSEGNDQLISLQEQGIGAIHLGYQNTPFNVKSADNELLAVVRASSFYITEEGDAGTIQQIDLTV